MAITASQVSALRQSTGCGMMDCKKALEEAQGDMEKAVEILRKKGIAKAAKKADRIASEGVIAMRVSPDGHEAVLVEVNSETDFVSRHEDFQTFAKKVADVALKEKSNDVALLLKATFDGDQTVADACQTCVVKLGENIQVRRVIYVQAPEILGAYLHGGRIGALVVLTGGDQTLAKDMAMHIVASKPAVVKSEDLSQDLLLKEKEIFVAQAKDSGKPDHIIEKMVEGRLAKFVDEISLVGQPFVKNPEITVGQLLKEKQAKVDLFVRFELGEKQ